MKKFLIRASVIILFALSPILAIAQTSAVAASEALPTSQDLIDSTKQARSSAKEVLRLQQESLAKQTANLEELRKLYADGLIARVELEKSEAELMSARAKVDSMQNQIASAEKLAADIETGEGQARIKRLIKPTSKVINYGGSSTVLRSTSGSWSIANLSSVQEFFRKTFGRALPTSAVGQSSTHNQLGWDHRNAVDVGIHPDSTEGRTLINYLQSAGIPFLAFRSAIPGVATGPHIHIGYPSHRLG